MNMKLQNAQNLKTCQEHREDEALVWILHKIMKIIFSQLIFFVCCFISFLPARVAVNSIVQKKRICAYGWFVRMENNNCIHNPNNYV